MEDVKQMLCDWANAAAVASPVPGAPYLTAASSRQDVAAWLQWNDPNGCHTDALAVAEGLDPYTDDTVWDALSEMFDDDGGPR